MNNQAVDDQMALLPPNYTGEVAVKPRRRRLRKKNNGEGSGTSRGFQNRKLSEEQVTMLEQHFASEHKLDYERKDRLALELGLDPRQLAVWFQNRRTRWKSKKLEDEYSTLKNQHATIIIEKCRLETEVLKLKQQLNEAEKEIKMVLERSSNSPTSSISMEPSSLGEFGVEVLEDMFYLPENDYTFMDWSGF